MMTGRGGADFPDLHIVTGKRNSSLNLPYVVEEISRIKNVSAEQIIEITNRNAKQMYRLSL